MEIKKENKFKKLFKRFGALGLALVISLAIALTIAFSIPSGKKGEQPVTNQVLSFDLPMNNASIVKDYANDRLQHNETLKRYEIHLSIDLASEDNSVFSICDGVVDSIKTDSLNGTVITISHEDGFKSVYSSLDKDVNVEEGDKVSKGQEIGKASNSAANETKAGGHLHFTLYKDNKAVDPNNYLDLQNK